MLFISKTNCLYRKEQKFLEKKSGGLQGCLMIWNRTPESSEQGKNQPFLAKLINIDRPLSHGGHVESHESKKFCFCTASLALNSRLAEACRAKTKFVLFPRDSTWPPSDKGLLKLSDLGALCNLIGPLQIFTNY